MRYFKKIVGNKVYLSPINSDDYLKYVEWLNNVDWEHDDGANDLHMLFGTLCCLTELQLALPGIICSDVPLRMVLDRRPFI